MVNPGEPRVYVPSSQRTDHPAQAAANPTGYAKRSSRPVSAAPRTARAPLIALLRLSLRPSVRFTPRVGLHLR